MENYNFLYNVVSRIFWFGGEAVRCTTTEQSRGVQGYPPLISHCQRCNLVQSNGNCYFEVG